MSGSIERVPCSLQLAKDRFMEIKAAIEIKLAERMQVRDQKATLRLLLSIHDSVIKVETLLLISTTESTAPSNDTAKRVAANGISASNPVVRSPSKANGIRPVERCVVPAHCQC